MISFNNRLRQLLLLSLIILLAILLFKHLFVFFPGILGAITFYILSRESYYKLTNERKWRKGWTALLYIIGYLIIIGLPLYAAIALISPKLTALINNPVEIMVVVKSFSSKIREATGLEIFTPENAKIAVQNLGRRLPVFLTGTANIVSNLLIMFFVLYYMLIHGIRMESFMENFIPLKRENLVLLSVETKLMIRANAIGIPLLALIQGFVGAIGYLIFGVNDVVLWGFITGIFSLIPIVGTGLAWLPLTVYLFATDRVWQGVGLALYSLIILTNIDYVARITLLRKIGDVHPLITVFGVIAGLSMFGFLGLIFGPLIISYFILLVKIYQNEFSRSGISSENKNRKES